MGPSHLFCRLLKNERHVGKWRAHAALPGGDGERELKFINECDKEYNSDEYVADTITIIT